MLDEARSRGGPALAAGLMLVGLIAVAGAIGPLLSPYDPIATDLGRALLPPSGAHWLGTDQFGRDVLTRILYAIRVDLPLMLISTASSFGFGLMLGCLSGYCGGWVDAVIGRVIDALLAFPHLVLVLLVVAVLGPGTFTVYLAITSAGWIAYARIMRAQIRAARAQQYVEAARALGVAPMEIVGRHLLPNTISVALVYAMADLVLNLQLLAALSFLGLGVQPPTPDWGAMIAEGRAFLLDVWGLSTWPGLTVALVGLGFSLLADGLRDLMDPQLRR
jgi:peptide/nickel transport system permease protein